MSIIQRFSSLKPTTKPNHPRPYWHVDAKWICSLILCGLLALWLGLMVVYKITDRQTAVPLMTNVITLGIQKGDAASQQKSLDELRFKIEASPTKSIQPIPGFPATLTEQDLQLTPDQLVQKIFGQVAAPMYDQGVKQLAQQQTSDPAQQAKFEQNASVFNGLSKQGHATAGKLAFTMLLVVLLVAAGAVWFSSGWGRLVTLAIVLLVVALPGLLLFAGLHAWMSHSGDALSHNPTNTIELVTAARGSFLPVASAGVSVYKTAVYAGLGLLALAFIGKTALSLVGWRAVERAKMGGTTRSTTES